MGAMAVLASLGSAQFVWPGPGDHDHEPGLYVEDPFITHYRQEFFAVFAGDYKRFEKAYAEIEAMTRKNPRDARALVWLGNGQTIKAALLLGRGDEAKRQSLALVSRSRETLNRAVALKPKDPNIYMMRAATLYVQGQTWPKGDLPRSVWATLRQDCLNFIDFLGPRLPKVSVHVRGETLGELGVAYLNLGEPEKARKAFERVIQLDPGTSYETRARKEIAKLSSKSPGTR